MGLFLCMSTISGAVQTIAGQRPFYFHYIRFGRVVKSFGSVIAQIPRNRQPQPQPPQQQLQTRFSRIMLQHQRIRPPGWA